MCQLTINSMTTVISLSKMGRDSTSFNIIVDTIENRCLGNSTNPSAGAAKKKHSKYGCKKPAPLPRTKHKAPQWPAEDHTSHETFGPFEQEEGYSTSSPEDFCSVLAPMPHEETGYEPGAESEDDQEDSGIATAGHWTGMCSYIPCWKPLA